MMLPSRLPPFWQGTALPLPICAWLALAPIAPHVRASQRIAPPSTKRVIPPWIGVYDVTGRCRYGIPSTWRVDGASGHQITRAPEGTVTVEQSWRPASSWASYKLKMRRTLKPSVVQEDTPQRLAFEYSGGWPGVHLFIATWSSAGVCATQIEIRPGAETTMKPTIDRIIREIVAPR